MILKDVSRSGLFRCSSKWPMRAMFSACSLSICSAVTGFAAPAIYAQATAEAQATAQAAAPAQAKKEAKAAERTREARVSLSHIARNGLAPYVESSARWGAEIAKLAAGNKTEGGEDKILLLGSSSIRLWDSAEGDLKNWKVVRRGYGGAKFCDAAMFTPNLVKGLQFQGAAIFVANDITGGEKDKSPEEVARLAKSVIESIQAENPDAPVLIISITATPSRFEAWPAIDNANAALASLAESMPNVHFLDTKERYLDAEGQPIPGYFVKDMLHQNAEGYRIWGELVAGKLGSIDGLKPAR